MSHVGLYFGNYNGSWFGSVAQEEIELLGGTMIIGDAWSRAKRIEAKKQKQAIDIIEDVLADLRAHEETPKSAYIKISEKSENNVFIRTALEQAIPHDFIYITESQIEQILSKIKNEYFAYLKYIEDEEIILVLYSN